MSGAITRRTAIARGSALAAALATPRLLLPQEAPAADLVPFSQPLRLPRVITDEDVVLPIVRRKVQVLPGARTTMWTFGGEFPGPTIRRPTGATTRVTFRHRIPDARSLTIHNHGHHNTSADDGQPNGEFFLPGESRTYTYEHREEGAPLRSAMRFYHDHSHGRTNLNSWMGLVGVFIVDDPAEADLGLPTGRRELVLVVTERSFDELNQLTDPFTGVAEPGDDSVGVGDVLLVNGVPAPYAEVRPTTYRLRVLNMASFNPYNLGFAEGAAKLVQVGTESGLVPAPLERERVMLGPAERADLVVDFSGMAGKDLVLDSVADDSRRSPHSSIPYAQAPETPVMQFRVRGTVRRAPKPLAPALRPLPEWVSQLSAIPDRVFAFGRGVGGDGTFGVVRQMWTINGRTFDPNFVAAKPELGSAETWMLVNASLQSHYVHLHAVDWKVVSRNGFAPDPHEDVLKETFRLDTGDVLVVGAKFTDHLGPFMLHCHMLSHEDHAMMTTFEVVEPGTGDRVPPRGTRTARARVRGQDVRVPLHGLTPPEATRVAAMLAAQARRPGLPAPAPVAPLRLGPEALALCEVETERGR